MCCFVLQDCHFGVDWDGPVSLNNDEDSVFIPSVPPLMNEHQKQLLMDELAGHNDEVHGIEHYIVARNFISQLWN